MNGTTDGLQPDELATSQPKWMLSAGPPLRFRSLDQTEPPGAVKFGALNSTAIHNHTAVCLCYVKSVWLRSLEFLLSSSKSGLPCSRPKTSWVPNCLMWQRPPRAFCLTSLLGNSVKPTITGVLAGLLKPQSVGIGGTVAPDLLSIPARVNCCPAIGLNPQTPPGTALAFCYPCSLTPVRSK